MRVISLNVGLPAERVFGEQVLTTGIVKRPMEGRLAAGPLGLTGDGQADRRVHGGESKAVYAFASEHYAWWCERLGRPSLPWGAFGENLTTEGLLEGDVHAGDRLRVGGAELEVTEPRQPCHKLVAHFDRADMRRLFADSGRTGFYLRVIRPGEIGAGDPIEWSKRVSGVPSVGEIVADWHSRPPSLVSRVADGLHLSRGVRRRLSSWLGRGRAG